MYPFQIRVFSINHVILSVLYSTLQNSTGSYYIFLNLLFAFDIMVLLKTCSVSVRSCLLPHAYHRQHKCLLSAKYTFDGMSSNQTKKIVFVNVITQFNELTYRCTQKL